MANPNKTSDELEREIEARRARIEARVDDISSQFSPGQFLDQALDYAKSGPGADFTRNLGRSVVDNPLPVALAAASIGWLAIQSSQPHSKHDSGYDTNAMYDHYALDEDDYPVAVITGTSIRRVGSSDQDGKRYTEFADTAGRKFKALSDEAGHRAGHFADESGRMYRGFIDETGHRVSDFRDELDNRIHQVSGWAAHNWRKAEKGASRVARNVRHGASHVGDSVRDGASHFGDRTQRAGSSLHRQGEHAAHAADAFVHRQPLVSGAIAFAIGALFGGVLPHTRQEDQLLGPSSDSVKRGAAHQAEHLYERGREEAEHLHDEARHAADDTYNKAKDAVRKGTEETKANVQNQRPH